MPKKLFNTPWMNDVPLCKEIEAATRNFGNTLTSRQLLNELVAVIATAETINAILKERFFDLGMHRGRRFSPTAWPSSRQQKFN
jgi:hypothetical protein